MRKSTEQSVRSDALRILTRREHSSAELKAKLIEKGHLAEAIDPFLAELIAQGWLSDQRFAEQFCTFKQKKYGNRRLAFTLQQKGITPEIIEETIAAHSHDEFNRARTIWQKKFGQIPLDASAKARQIRFLQYRGFELDLILRLLRELEQKDSYEVC